MTPQERLNSAISENNITGIIAALRSRARVLNNVIHQSENVTEIHDTLRYALAERAAPKTIVLLLDLGARVVNETT